ncbi:MAG: hypothetical protein IIA17_09035 [candidate division Zixibacteria bacterium]|nr:hypothetical protein [candidate division Zixibacteria bacterium]
MIQINKRTRLFVYAIAISMVLAVAVISFTDVSTIEAVSLSGTVVKGWTEKYNLKKNTSVLNQPYDELTAQMLRPDSALKVEISFSWPHTLNLELNSMTPCCLLLGKENGRIFGLDKNCRVVPLAKTAVDWERPLFTGIEKIKLYEVCLDSRVKRVLDALEKLRVENINFYRLIEQIDFGKDKRIEIMVSGLDHKVWVSVDRTFGDLNRYLEFITGFELDLENIKLIDMRLEEMVITREKGA